MKNTWKHGDCENDRPVSSEWNHWGLKSAMDCLQVIGITSEPKKDSHEHRISPSASRVAANGDGHDGERHGVVREGSLTRSSIRRPPRRHNSSHMCRHGTVHWLHKRQGTPPCTSPFCPVLSLPLRDIQPLGLRSWLSSFWKKRPP